MPRRLTDNARNAGKVSDHAGAAASWMHELFMGAVENKQESLADALEAVYTAASELRNAADVLRKFYSTEQLEPGDNQAQVLALLDQLTPVTGDASIHDALVRLKNKMTGQAESDDENWARVQ